MTISGSGTLRLTADSALNARLFKEFASGKVTFAIGGGTIDTQNFTIFTSASLGGVGDLVKNGEGILSGSTERTLTAAAQPCAAASW